MFKYSTYLILPICLIQAANFSGLMGSMTDLSAMQTSGGIGENPLAALGPSFALNYGSNLLLMLGRFAVDFPDLCDGAIVQ